MSLPRLMRRQADRYHFVGDRRTGVTFRWGATEAEDAIVAPWPELVDISITNRCPKQCPSCHRDSTPDGPHMAEKDWGTLLTQLVSPRWGPVFQVALGGGEPTLHPAFPRMLADCQARGMIPNYTTSGHFLSNAVLDASARFAGAVAVSWHRGLGDSVALAAVARLREAGVRKVNVHFLLGTRTLRDAMMLLAGGADHVLSGVDAVTFLTAKPVGRCGPGEVLDCEYPGFGAFLRLLQAPRCAPRVGVDPCLVPALIQRTDLDLRTMDTCEGGFFSLFVDERLTVRPCSFADDTAAHSLCDYPLAGIWDDRLEPYRQRITSRLSDCADCRGAGRCRGPCPFFPGLYRCA